MSHAPAPGEGKSFNEVEKEQVTEKSLTVTDSQASDMFQSAVMVSQANNGLTHGPRQVTASEVGVCQ